MLNGHEVTLRHRACSPHSLSPQTVLCLQSGAPFLRSQIQIQMVVWIMRLQWPKEGFTQPLSTSSRSGVRSVTLSLGLIFRVTDTDIFFFVRRDTTAAPPRSLKDQRQSRLARPLLFDCSLAIFLLAGVIFGVFLLVGVVFVFLVFLLFGVSSCS